MVCVHSGALTWADIEWMGTLSHTMKVIVKGIMTGEDAALAAQTPGVAAIVVSNHGGRQIDGAMVSHQMLLCPARATFPLLSHFFFGYRTIV